MERVADLAAGHGLLSWFLLAMDPNNRTAVCVDRRMPQSAEKFAQTMISQFPHLEPKWSYVQTDLTTVEAHPSTLMTSVHACGTLSDFLVDMAIGANAPLALVPCCHTVDSNKGYKPHILSGLDTEDVSSMVAAQRNDARTTIGDIVDGVRSNSLKNAGYNVKEAMLPLMFTQKNRLMLATPGNESKEKFSVQ
eukprot:6484780-Ditylum_brightwellii.AAC.1